MYKLSNRSKSRLEGINNILLNIIDKGISNSPYDFGIPQFGGLRTSEDQYALYVRGASQRDGYNKESYHQSGNAFDIYIYINGRASWDADMLEAVAKHLQNVAFEEFGVTLRWGGDWDGDGIRVDKDDNEHFFDGAHFEIRENKENKENNHKLC